MYNSQLYNTPYHSVDLSQYKFLITGGAGFIGSNLVEYLLRYNAGYVRVLDNLSNGYFENIRDFIDLPNFEFIEGDIRNLETCKKAVEGIDFISHQAALGSVPRSLSDPTTTNEVNISGFLNMLVASRDSSSCKSFVYAASSSSYGDSSELPKVEGKEGKPLSPYAITKVVNEMYADVFSKVYNFHSIGLRYFNVFGPKQNPNNPYAAVIPIFCKHFIEGTSPTIYGDGETSRDFTFVENAVQANLKALFVNYQNDINNSFRKLEKKYQFNQHEVFNVACGDQNSLNQIIQILNEITGRKDIKPKYEENRVGDIKHSRASLEKITRILGYNPEFNVKKGLKLVLEGQSTSY